MYVATLLPGKSPALNHDDWFVKQNIERVYFYRLCRNQPDTCRIPDWCESGRFLKRVATNDDRYAGNHLIVQEQFIWMAHTLSLDDKPVSLDFNPPQTFIDLLRETARLDAYFSFRQVRKRMYELFTNNYNQTQNYLNSSIGNKQNVRLPAVKRMSVPFSTYKNQHNKWNKIDNDLIKYLRKSRDRQLYRTRRTK